MNATVIAGIAAATAVLAVVIVAVVRSIGVRVLREADGILLGERIVLRDGSANLFGVRSRGMGQVRGNGVLSLTDRRLHFLMWLPRRELSIPIRAISAVDTPQSFLGKTMFRPLLQIDFENEAGELDAAAWLVRDLHAWRNAIEQAAELEE